MILRNNAADEVSNLNTSNGSTTTISVALQVIKANVVDVGSLAQKGFSENPNEIIKNGGQLNGFTDQNIKAVDFGTMIKECRDDGSGNHTGDYKNIQWVTPTLKKC